MRIFPGPKSSIRQEPFVTVNDIVFKIPTGRAVLTWLWEYQVVSNLLIHQLHIMVHNPRAAASNKVSKAAYNLDFTEKNVLSTVLLWHNLDCLKFLAAALNPIANS